MLNPKKERTRQEQRAAVFRAVQLIEDRLDKPPGIAELARVACLSHFHFQRAFHEVVGETVTHFGTRIRIEHAATLLRFSAWQIQEIALEVGFATQAAFTRAFKRHFGCPPLAYREQCLVAPFLKGPMRKRGDNGCSDDVDTPRTMVQLEAWPALDVIAIRYHGPASGLLQPWQELRDWARIDHPDLEGVRCFGLWFDEWNEGPEHPARYRYEAALTVPSTWVAELPPHLHRRTLPAGTVATAQAAGTFRQLDEAWRRFGYGWLPHSGYQPRTAYALDEYPRRLVFGSRLHQAAAGLVGFTLTLCLPVKI
jgi:AraC family transcriptional regulator